MKFENLTPALYLAVQTGGLDVLTVQKILIPIPFLKGQELSGYDAVMNLKYSVPMGTAILNKTDGAGGVVAGAHFMLQKKTYIGETGALPEGAETGSDVDGRFFWETVQEDIVTNEHGQIVMEKLVFGMYRVVETYAPQGYVPDDTPHFFEVKHAGEIETTGGIVHSVDEAVPEVTVVNERSDFNAKMKVTKVLTDDSGREIFAEKAVFYAALFSDKERTDRVTDVMALRYKNSASASVTFEGLDKGKTYYVGETDKNGNLAESGSVGDIVYVANYPDGYESSTDGEHASGKVNFRNVFLELPEDYYYGGKLTITKRVLLNGAKYRTDDVYYAALFHDAEHTERCGEVIELAMDGRAERSVVVPASVGCEECEVITYYVAETRWDGTPLTQNSSLDFNISIDKEKVEMSFENDEEEVTITNEFTEETDTGDSDDGGRDEVLTGDDTPIMWYLVMLLAAVAAIGAMLRQRRLRRTE